MSTEQRAARECMDIAMSDNIDPVKEVMFAEVIAGLLTAPPGEDEYDKNKQHQKAFAELDEVLGTPPAGMGERADSDALRCAEASAWLTIETAPKDGTRIDLWATVDPQMEDGFERYADAFWSVDHNWWCKKYAGRHDTTVLYASHWVRKPSPPTQSGHSALQNSQEAALSSAAASPPTLGVDPLSTPPVSPTTPSAVVRKAALDWVDKAPLVPLCDGTSDHAETVAGEIVTALTALITRERSAAFKEGMEAAAVLAAKWDSGTSTPAGIARLIRRQAGKPT